MNKFNNFIMVEMSSKNIKNLGIKEGISFD